MKEFQLLVCAKRSTRDGIGRLSLFEGRANVKQGDGYEGYSLTVLALHLATSAQAAEKPSQSFLKKAIQGNYAEVEMGKLTQQNGQSDNVKNFGQCLYKERVRYRDAKGCCSLEIY